MGSRGRTRYRLPVRVTVVGAGVIGLTTARLLEERGHAVHVVAAATDQATTSAVAGAVWFPYRCGPLDRVIDWGQRTRTWLATLAAIPETGVDSIVGYEIEDSAESIDGPVERPWWAAGIDVDRVRAPVTGAPAAWRYATFRIEPAVFLPWLARGLRHGIEGRSVADLAAEPGDAVIDCTGLAARELTGDGALVGLFGQILIAEPGTWDLSTTLTDDRDPDATFYVIPRRAELVIGGCSIPWPAGTPVVADPEITARIEAHARRLGIEPGELRETRVGLRPFRPAIRLERDPDHPRVIHCYGHGGAGFTLCRGCAEDVAALVAVGARSAT